MLFIAFHVNVWWGTCCSSLCMLMFGGVRVAFMLMFGGVRVASLCMLMFGGVRVVHRFSSLCSC